MYTVDSRDRVLRLTDVPQSAVGAPFPLVLAAERLLLLAYLAEVTPEDWDGTTVRMVNAESADEIVALVTFSGPHAHMFGPPNDEAFAGHPLAARGFGPYDAFRVEGSSWVRGLERRNRVHPRHRRERFDALTHYVFAFHDSTFECLAEGYSASIHPGSLAGLLPQMMESARRAAE